MKLEATKGASHAADAASAFVTAVQKHLAREAFQEIRGLSLNQVRQWAEKWCVDAPCILEIALDWCEGGWTEGSTISSYWSPAIPREWFETLNELNALPIDSTWLASGLENVMSDGERRTALGNLKSLSPSVPLIVKLTPDGQTQAVREGPGDRERKRYLLNELPAYRDHLLDQNCALAPIRADPLRESETSFLTRARDHFQARVRKGEQKGYTRVSPKSNLDQQIDWLIRFQLHRQSRRAIAAKDNKVREAVDRAIRELAALLDLRLRPTATDAE